MELPTPRHDIAGLISAVKPATDGGAAPNEKPQIRGTNHRFLWCGTASVAGSYSHRADCIGWEASVSARLCMRILTPNLAHTVHQPLPEFIYEASNGEVCGSRQSDDGVNTYLQEICSINMTEGQTLAHARNLRFLRRLRHPLHQVLGVPGNADSGCTCYVPRGQAGSPRNTWGGFHAMHRSRTPSTSHVEERRCCFSTGFQIVQGHNKFPPLTTPSAAFSLSP